MPDETLTQAGVRALAWLGCLKERYPLEAAEVSDLDEFLKWVRIEMRWPSPDEPQADNIRDLGGRKKVYSLLPEDVKGQPLIRFWVAPIAVLADWMRTNMRWPEKSETSRLEDHLANYVGLVGNGKRTIAKKLPEDLRRQNFVKFYVDASVRVKRPKSGFDDWQETRDCDTLLRIGASN